MATRSTSDGLPIGRVTSGSFSPTLGRAIGMGYVQAGTTPNPGTVVSVDIRGRPIEAEVTLLTLLRRAAGADTRAHRLTFSSDRSRTISWDSPQATAARSLRSQ